MQDARGWDKTRNRNADCGSGLRKRIPEADSANEDKTRNYVKKDEKQN
jgi:hypothetical protein